ncbi:MAG: cellulose biosynthesis cyclic di-GMP-binding regulatory protein BcsB [Candidatus Methylacidiphilales bacterium]|nr:cellulose biosynthesis cyclic di-GMP-binding regulatory protein BcsB [Candidatus Methylacidiphilales bacterium]
MRSILIALAICLHITGNTFAQVIPTPSPTPTPTTSGTNPPSVVTPGVTPSTSGNLPPGAPAPAPATSSAAAPVLDPNTRTLASFMDKDGQVMLRHDEAQYRFSIPLSARMNVTGGQVVLNYVNSISLLGERSQIYVTWDQKVLGQLPLLGTNPTGRLIAPLDIKGYTKPGYHDLHINVAQHYTLKCENPSAPELWTQVDPLTSTVTLQYELKPLKPRLSELSDLIDDKLWLPFKLHIVTTSSNSMQDHHLQWGALVTQRASLLLKYRPLELTHSAGLIANGDQVVIGTRDELSAILPASISDSINNSFIGIFANPKDPRYFILVVSGRDIDGVTKAAKAFAALSFPLPATPTMEVADVALPEIPVREMPSTAQPSTSYKFSQFGFRSGTLQGMNTGGFRITVNMPADIYAAEHVNLRFRLHFAHGARLRPDSVFNVFLNGRFENVIYLNTDSGSVYRDYSLTVPLRSFDKGANLIEFVPQMVPLVSDQCEIIQTENLLFTLFDDSVMDVPAATRYVQMPNLRLTGRTGFPYLEKSTGATCAIQVAAPDSGSVAAAWMILAKLTRLAGAPLTDAIITFRRPPEDRDWIVVGVYSQVDPKLAAAAPIKFLTGGQIPNVFNKLPEGTATISQGFMGFLKSLGLDTSEPPADPVKKLDTVSGSNSPADLGVLMQFESPYASGRTITLATATSGEILQARVASLVKDEWWSSINGDSMIWGEPLRSIANETFAKPYYLGSYNPGTAIQYQFSQRPWLWIVCVFALVIVFALLTRKVLFAFRTRVHGKGGKH